MLKSKKKIHTNVLRQSSIDVIQLAYAVQQRFLDCCGLNERINGGEELMIPQDLDPAMILWRTMCVRHKKGDYRHTDDEFKATTQIADWTLQVVKALRNQPPPKPIEWDKDA